MALRRIIGQTTLQNSKIAFQLNLGRLFSRSPISLYSEKDGQHVLSEKFLSKPECQSKSCDPVHPRADDYATSQPLGFKTDEPGVYKKCPPPVEVKKFKCSDLPMEPKPQKRKRKPFVPASACKKPKPSPSAGSCERLMVEKCEQLAMENCLKARNPPKCVREFLRPDCKSAKAPFPAYSECFKPPKKTRKNECECLESERLCL